jgi:hypothetical protein
MKTSKKESDLQDLAPLNSAQSEIEIDAKLFKGVPKTKDGFYAFYLVLSRAISTATKKATKTSARDYWRTHEKQCEANEPKYEDIFAVGFRKKTKFDGIPAKTAGATRLFIYSVLVHCKGDLSLAVKSFTNDAGRHHYQMNPPKKQEILEERSCEVIGSELSTEIIGSELSTEVIGYQLSTEVIGTKRIREDSRMDQPENKNPKRHQPEKNVVTIVEDQSKKKYESYTTTVMSSNISMQMNMFNAFKMQGVNPETVVKLLMKNMNIAEAEQLTLQAKEKTSQTKAQEKTAQTVAIARQETAQTESKEVTRRLKYTQKNDENVRRHKVTEKLQEERHAVELAAIKTQVISAMKNVNDPKDVKISRRSKFSKLKVSKQKLVYAWKKVAPDAFWCKCQQLGCHNNINIFSFKAILTEAVILTAQIVDKLKIVCNKCHKKTSNRLRVPRYNNVKTKSTLWIYQFGEVQNALCCCCNKTDMNYFDEWHKGHVISKKDGGSDMIENIRPICPECNRSMGTENMDNYMKNQGYAPQKAFQEIKAAEEGYAYAMTEKKRGDIKRLGIRKIHN